MNRERLEVDDVCPPGGGTAVKAARVLPAGLGFALAFGWLWFPVLRESLLAGLFAGAPAFRPLVFGLALGAGCLLYGFVSGRLENGTAGQQRLNAVLAHGLCCALLGLSALCRNGAIAPVSLPEGLPEVLAGLAASAPGIWWFAHLLRRGPGTAVAGLAVAALAALALSFLLAPLAAALPGGPDTALVALGAGLAAALLTALLLLYGENRACLTSPLPLSPLKTPLSGAGNSAGRAAGSPAVSPPGALAAAALLLFGLGSLNALAAISEAFVPAAAHAGGLILAACVLSGKLWRMKSGASAHESGIRAGVANGTEPWRYLRRSMLAGACGLVLLSLILSLFPESARLLLPLVGALPEAAGLALCALALRGLTAECEEAPKPVAARFAGLSLAVVLLAVNTGYLAGERLAELAGVVGPALPALAAALLLVVVGGMFSGSAPETTGAAPGEPDGNEACQAGGDGASGVTVHLHPAIAAQLTERERALALLLVRGCSNREVSDTLGLSENTVRWYIKKLNKKTGASGRSALIEALLSG